MSLILTNAFRLQLHIPLMKAKYDGGRKTFSLNNQNLLVAEERDHGCFSWKGSLEEIQQNSKIKFGA